MTVTVEQIAKLAELARLELSAEETAKIKGSLEELIEYMGQIKKLDLKDVEPMMLLDASEKSWRTDRAVSGLNKSDAFKNAPSVHKDHFAIPKTVK